jgi:hypothetical protein
MAETTSQPKTSGMVTVYRVLAIVTTLVIILQFFLAGLGTFHAIQAGNADDFSLHEKVGYVISALGLVMLVIAALARLGTRVIVMGGVMFILAGPVQALLAEAGKDHSDVWGALHGLVGALLIGLVSTMIRVGRSS